MIGVWIPGVEKPGRCEDCFALQGDETDCWCGLGVWDLQESPPAVVPEGCKVEGVDLHEPAKDGGEFDKFLLDLHSDSYHEARPLPLDTLDDEILYLMPKVLAAKEKLIEHAGVPKFVVLNQYKFPHIFDVYARKRERGEIQTIFGLEILFSLNPHKFLVFSVEERDWGGARRCRIETADLVAAYNIERLEEVSEDG